MKHIIARSRQPRGETHLTRCGQELVLDRNCSVEDTCGHSDKVCVVCEMIDASLAWAEAMADCGMCFDTYTSPIYKEPLDRFKRACKAYKASL